MPSILHRKLIITPPTQFLQKNTKNIFSYSSSSSSSSSLPNSITTALKLLNLQPHSKFSPKELRDAYFTAAKLCHPDSPNAKLILTKNSKDIHNNRDLDEETRKEQLTHQFHAITEAYELLQNEHTNIIQTSSSSSSSFEYITKSEEEHFRQSCIEFLGVDAEIVEESKRCPLFREWLKGRTVDAFLWNTFLMKHGGLAPMLRRDKEKTISLMEGDGGRRRRRKR